MSPVKRILAVRAVAAARMIANEESKNAVVLADANDVEPGLVGNLHFLRGGWPFGQSRIEVSHSPDRARRLRNCRARIPWKALDAVLFGGLRGDCGREGLGSGLRLAHAFLGVEHRCATQSSRTRHLVLQNVPVLGQLAVFDTEKINDDLRRGRQAVHAPVDGDEIALGDDHTGLVIDVGR